MDIFLAADVQNINAALARSATNRSARAVAARAAAVARRTISGVKRLKRRSDAEPTGDAAGDAKRLGAKRFGVKRF